MGISSLSTIGRIVAIWLTIFTFFAQGLEHCVVNMFVIPTAMMLDASNCIFDWRLWNQIPDTIGNILGASVFTGFFLYRTHSKKTNQNLNGIKYI